MRALRRAAATVSAFSSQTPSESAGGDVRHVGAGRLQRQVAYSNLGGHRLTTITAIVGYGDPRWRITRKDAVESDDAVPLSKRDLGPEILRTAASFVAPIHFAPRRAGNQAINNGTIFFLDCGEGAFGVTADHVFQRFVNRTRAEPDLRCQIADLPFAPDDRLIDRDA